MTLLNDTCKIFDENDFIEDANDYGIWYPRCPFCGSVQANGVETDIEDIVECEMCDKKFKVEGV